MSNGKKKNKDVGDARSAGVRQTGQAEAGKNGTHKAQTACAQPAVDRGEAASRIGDTQTALSAGGDKFLHCAPSAHTTALGSASTSAKLIDEWRGTVVFAGAARAAPRCAAALALVGSVA